MGREIKFRAWDKEQKKMAYLDTMGICYEYSCLTFHSEELSGICQWPVEGGESLESQVIMQFTGLKEKNGREIYEGDIVRRVWANKDEGVWEVHWSEDRWHLKNGNRSYDNGDYYHGHEVSWDIHNTSYNTEVIGNIHENPELLK